jgi:hypothetical protein
MGYIGLKTAVDTISPYYRNGVHVRKSAGCSERNSTGWIPTMEMIAEMKAH